MSSDMGKIEKEAVELDVTSGKIFLNPEQDRIILDQNKLHELAENIRQHGLKDPISVAKHPTREEFTIIDGERRFRSYLINREIDISENSISANDEYFIKAMLYLPQTDDEYTKLLFIGMDNGNEQSVSITPLEKGVSYREKVRPKKISGKTIKEYDGVTNLAENLLGFVGKRTLSDFQNNIKNNKIKTISKLIRNASTTHHIEDKITFENGIDDRYLIYKIVELGRVYQLQAIGVGEQRLIEKEKWDSFEILSEKEKDILSEEDLIKYENEESQRKKAAIVNKIYDDLCELIYNGTYNLDDEVSYIQWKKEIDEKINSAIEMATEIKNISANKAKKDYKNVGCKYESTKKGCKLNIDYSELGDEAQILVNQLLKIIEEKNSEVSKGQ